MPEKYSSNSVLTITDLPTNLKTDENIQAIQDFIASIYFSESGNCSIRPIKKWVFFGRVIGEVYMITNNDWCITLRGNVLTIKDPVAILLGIDFVDEKDYIDVQEAIVNWFIRMFDFEPGSEKDHRIFMKLSKECIDFYFRKEPAL